MKQVSQPRMEEGQAFLLSTHYSLLSTFKAGGGGQISYRILTPPDLEPPLRVRQLPAEGFPPTALDSLNESERGGLKPLGLLV